jgi:hypothetical protein
MANDTQMIHNVNSGDIEIIELTDEEQAQLDSERAAWVLARDEAKAEKEAKKVAAEAKLALLGLVTEDLKALGL